LLLDVPAVRTLSIAGIVCEVFGFSYATAVPVLARDILSTGAEGLGSLNAAASVGGTVGVVLLTALPGRIRREPVLGTVFLLYGGAILALAASGALPVAAAALVVIGACAAGFDALQQTLLQLAVPEEQRGRAVGIWVLGLGSAPIGHLEIGALAAALGAPGALAINGCLVLAGAATLLVRAPLYRWPIRAGAPA
jgi:predicted MFS family arabinose efflux permease